MENQENQEQLYPDEDYKEFVALKLKSAEKLTAEICQLNNKLGIARAASAKKDKRLERLEPIEKLFKQVDSWKEKQLTITIDNKDTAKNIMAFAERYGLDVNMFVQLVFNQLFLTDEDNTTLGLIIAGIMNNGR